jgi:hypothetical protein
MLYFYDLIVKIGPGVIRKDYQYLLHKIKIVCHEIQ